MRDHPVVFWSAVVSLGVVVVAVIMAARLRKSTGRQTQMASVAMFIVCTTVPALLALLVAGLLPPALWRVGSAVLPLVAVILGLRFWQRGWSAGSEEADDGKSREASDAK